MMGRTEFVIIFCIGSIIWDVVWWIFSGEFDPGWIISVLILVPACGMGMPDRVKK